MQRVDVQFSLAFQRNVRLERLYSEVLGDEPSSYDRRFYRDRLNDLHERKARVLDRMQKVVNTSPTRIPLNIEHLMAELYQLNTD